MQINAKDARNRFAEVVNRAAFGKERLIVMKNGKPAAAIVSMEDLKTLEEAEFAAAMERVGERYDGVFKRLAE
ncbi:MAG: type II toxin-antitoxin system Phd/YefM family antitoxin [Candidatus Sericytochromatia bacterium]